MRRITKRPTNSSVPTMLSKPSSNWQMTWTRRNGTRTRRQQKRATLELLAFLARHVYPFRADWPLRLLRQCDLWTLRDCAGIKAAVWLERLGNGTAALHLCASRDAHGRWILPRVLRSLSDGARRSGYHTLTAAPLPQHIPYLGRLGFSQVGDKFHLSLYGQTQHSEDP